MYRSFGDHIKDINNLEARINNEGNNKIMVLVIKNFKFVLPSSDEKSLDIISMGRDGNIILKIPLNGQK